MTIYELIRNPYWSKDPDGFYIRKRSDYSSNTPARIEHRLKFGEASYRSFGATGDINGLPVSAAIVQDQLLREEIDDIEKPEVRVVRVAPSQFRVVKRYHPWFWTRYSGFES